MFRLLFVSLLFFHGTGFAQTKYPAAPDELYGQLFIDIQIGRIFPDSKTFVDCIPLQSPGEILAQYGKEKHQPGFDLKKFVLQHFQLPAAPKQYSSDTKDIRKHIAELWNVLERSADTVKAGSSLLPLPYPYIVPGGRFREVYYWDSYFTMLGLKESGEYGMMENMVKNFAYLIKTYGHIPNGNRSYYLSRSQPPFFSLMVELLASVKGNSIFTEYHDVLESENNYWQDNKDAYKYRDDLAVPRQESYAEDHTVAMQAALEYRKRVRFADSNRLKAAVDSIYALTCYNLRSAAASGWDFSSRWMNGDELYTTRISSIVPVDLHSLIFHLTKVVIKGDTGIDKTERATVYGTIQDSFTVLLKRNFFNERLGWYCDYDPETKQVMSNPTLAGMYPLFFRLADKKDVSRVVEFLKKNFLKDGGVITSLNNTGQQWDAPNGWAPLQWITIIGLENYGYHDLAREIATRWVNLNKKVFNKTGKLMEKYDVVDITKPAGGGEYPSQDGFGWTNGVLLALMNKYKL
jgi:alpha,alpha-trehalase